MKNMTTKNRVKLLFTKGLIFDLFIIGLQLGAWNTAQAAVVTPNEERLLQNSQISYRAEGGFTGVQSYGVILSCVNGRISVMKSIYDPRLPADKAQMREIASMDKDTYLKLWDDLNKQAFFKTPDAPQPKHDIADEFTVNFHAKIGEEHHEFQVYGISLPSSSRYFGIRKRIDDSVNMSALWYSHKNVARSIESKLPASITQ